MLWVRRVFALALFVAVLYLGWSFAADHASRVTIKYPGGEFGDVRLWMALLVAFGAGVVLTGALALVQVTRLRLVARRYRKTARGLEKEVHQLRNLPLSPDRPEPDEGETGAVHAARGRGA